ncbi:MAG: exosortase system-associated protein, TIGR04073 family [Methyloprofundus sp.]|nr:exosortase system-associated protein, TIGR04073 family [Methyloprofundus sp.]
MTRNKKTLLSLFACLLFLFSSIGIAEERSYGEKVGHKTLRSLSNMTLGILEVPKGIIKTSNDSNMLYGVTAGTFLGLLNTVGRTGVGVIDFISFPLATKPVIQPVHPWQNYLTLPTSYEDVFVLDF